MTSQETQQVLDGSRRWWVECADCISFLRSLPDRSVSLIVTSPPYEIARTYGIGFSAAGQAWVDWLAPVIVEACRVSSGLVFLNAAGQVRERKYSPVVEWLAADLTRQHGVVCGPPPYCYFRHGVPGSGGDQYHRRDWEPVYSFCLPDRLPLAWSDNCAMGKPPKWAPGGEMSNRLSDGTRVNQWGGHETTGRTTRRNGKKGKAGRPSHRRANCGATSGRKDGDTVNGAHYDPPTIANPGNVVREQYDAEEIRQLLMGGDVGGPVIQGSPGGDVIRCLVGGGHMGSKKAHQSEAPFSEVLCEYLIRSYAKPDSIVCDYFSGSGTVAAVSVRLGRRFIGCDLRESQVEITKERVGGETPPFPGME